MTTRDEIELYVTGNYDGDTAALESALTNDPALATIAADEARFELLLRDAAMEATFCPACDDLVRGERCDSCGAAMRPGGYVVERVLVSNAHGRMYVAHDADGRQVALKELAFVHVPSADAIAAFEREAKFLRALEHPAIPRFLASFEEGHGAHARYYLAQELVIGDALDRLDDHWYNEAEIVELAKQVLEILVYLQSLSPMVIHRDIKPANLLRRRDGKIALVDFGAAYVQGTTAGSTTIGTFGYMPIEQLAGIVDATTDVYALGASLLHLLTRQEPWRLAQSRTTLNVSAPLRAFFDKMIAPDARDRFPSAKDALVALDRRDQLAPRKRRRLHRPAILAAAGAVAFAVSGAGIYVAGTHASSQARSFATLKIELPAGIERELQIDGKRIANVKLGDEVPALAGRHHVALTGSDGAPCVADLVLAPDQTASFACATSVPKREQIQTQRPVRRPPDPLPHGKLVDLSFKGSPLHDVLRLLAGQCELNLVVPDTIEAKVTVRFTKVPCDQAIEVLLESHGLWYDYQPVPKLIRIAPRRELDQEADMTEVRMQNRGEHWVADDQLPSGGKVDLDFLHGSLQQVLPAIAKGANGPINVVIPETIAVDSGTQGVTIAAKGVPWESALQAVLASRGLWYRYRDNGRVLRIAPRRELDAEDEAEIVRSGHP